MLRGVEAPSNGNTSFPSLHASEGPLFVATTPTTRLTFAPSHVDHAQACGPRSRQFQYLQVVLIEGNGTRLQALAQLPTPTN
jgi:hypothetical protein